MHRVQPRGEFVEPALPTVIQMDYTLGNESPDKSQELKVIGMINTATGFAGATAPVKGRTFVSRDGANIFHMLVCSEVCAADRP